MDRSLDCRKALIAAIQSVLGVHLVTALWFTCFYTPAVRASSSEPAKPDAVNALGACRMLQTATAFRRGHDGAVHRGRARFCHICARQASMDFRIRSRDLRGTLDPTRLTSLAAPDLSAPVAVVTPRQQCRVHALLGSQARVELAAWRAESPQIERAMRTLFLHHRASPVSGDRRANVAVPLSGSRGGRSRPQDQCLISPEADFLLAGSHI